MTKKNVDFCSLPHVFMYDKDNLVLPVMVPEPHFSKHWKGDVILPLVLQIVCPRRLVRPRFSTAAALPLYLDSRRVTNQHEKKKVVGEWRRCFNDNNVVSFFTPITTAVAL